jgi:hypothetical protein
MVTLYESYFWVKNLSLLETAVEELALWIIVVLIAALRSFWEEMNMMVFAASITDGNLM